MGHFFYEELVSNLASSEDWEGVMKYSNGAVLSPVNEDKFSIWYYKAASECLLSHLGECEESARKANSLASR